MDLFLSVLLAVLLAVALVLSYFSISAYWLSEPMFRLVVRLDKPRLHELDRRFSTHHPSVIGWPHCRFILWTMGLRGLLTVNRVSESPALRDYCWRVQWTTAGVMHYGQESDS